MLQNNSNTDRYKWVSLTVSKSLYSYPTFNATCLILPRKGSRKAFKREVKKKNY